MQAEQSGRTSTTRAALGALGAAAALAIAIGAPSAEAALIVPHGATHTVNVAPAPPPSSAPAAAGAAPSSPPPLQSSTAPPSLPAPQVASGGHAAVPESDIAGAGIPGAASDAPYPEGLPNHWEDGCDVSCKQEWLSYYGDRATAVWEDAVAGGTADEKKAAELLRDEVREIEAEITAAGGTPGEDDGEPSDASAGSAGGDLGSGSVAQAGVSASTVEPDAISGASPLVTDVLGVWDGTWVADVLGAGIWEALNEALWSADVGPCPNGSLQRADQQVTDPNGGTNRCF